MTEKKDKLNVELSTIICYEKYNVEKVRKVLKIIEREKKEVFDDLDKVPLEGTPLFHKDCNCE